MATISFQVRRYSPGRDHEPCWQDYPVETHTGMTILEGLQWIRETLDATLSWRHSCRMGVCGSCAMVINGKPGLACNTQIQKVSDQTIKLEALWNFPVAKDLVADLMPMFEKHHEIDPFLIRGDGGARRQDEREFAQTPDELDEFLQFTSCIKCGACMAACPTMASDPHFLGPMPMTAAHRYNRDSRDDGFARRKAQLSRYHSIAHCHYAAECTRVCPKGVDPARAIQLMKRDLTLDLFKLRKKRTARPRPPTTPLRHKELCAPRFTVRRE